jgi:hypothetical protein
MKRLAAALAALMGAGALTAMLLLASAAPASAHVVTVVGKYQITVGWDVEPTYSGQPNAVYLGVKDAATLQPVDDIGNSLRVVVSTGNQSFPPMQPELSFDSDTGLGSHGVFLAPIIPTAPGVYTFKFSGSINGQAVTKSFTSSDSTFDDVADPSTVEFPTKTPTVAELSTNAARLNSRVAAAESKASSAHDSASTATTLAIVALIVGGGLGIAGLVFGLRARRPSTS